MSRLLVIGVGNRDRGDDAVGPVVCDLLGELAPEVRTVVVEGNVLDLPARWSADDAVVIVDAAAPAGEPGRVFEVDALAERLVAPAALSTHTVDVSAAVELARAMGALPRSLTIVGIEAATDELGAPLTAAVRAAADRVVARLAAHSPPR